MKQIFLQDKQDNSRQDVPPKITQLKFLKLESFSPFSVPVDQSLRVTLQCYLKRICDRFFY